ncbi:uncharacterized protein LOC34623759 [Cyclospora cayetanensis]|uniref:Uncharacterized protein LOC34623759 n=1 Tax=Cyclospora cayetanensis TaxID=88456 RepID=A0A6P6RZG8_9EIME|nr:uncharacterized protein LOC34623759 [Cyclospora cayetanensis]
MSDEGEFSTDSETHRRGRRASTDSSSSESSSSENGSENGSENSQDDKRSDISEDDEDFLQHGQERVSHLTPSRRHYATFSLQASDAEEFLWGRSTATAAPDDAAASDGELFDEADYLRGEPGASRGSANAGATNLRGVRPTPAASAAAAAKAVLQQQRHHDAALFDEEAPPFLRPVLLHDAAARLRKQQLILAALNDLAHTEVRHDAAAAAAAAAAALSAVAGGNEAGPDKPLQQQNWQTGLPSQNSEASDSPQLHRQEQQEQQEREKQQGQQEQQQGQQEQQFQKALLQQQNPKLARIMQSVFGKKKPVGRFGPFVQQISDQQQASSRASGEEKASGMQPREGSSVARAAGAVAATDHVSTVELSISPMAVRNLKDANLLLKREGCSGDGTKQQQYLYEIEDGHLAYQHPRFCIFAIFEKDLVLRCLSPLWQRLCSLYDEAEAGSEEQQQQYLLLLQLLRCLSSLACPPPDEWIKFWLKFSAVLDSGKTWKRRVQDAEAVDKDAAGKDRLQGLSSEEQQAAQDLIEEERRKRSHIKTKEALTCGRLWLLLAKFYFDQTLLLERKGRNTPLQQEIEELKARQDALYTREKLLKDQLTATHEDEADVLEESPVAADTAEERQPSGRLRRGGVAEIQRLRASLRTELEALKEELFAVTEAIASANRRLRDLVDRAKAAVASVQHFVCAALELPAASTAAAMGGNPPYVAAQKQLRLVKSMLQHGVQSKRGSILQLLLQDVQHLLFAEMQRQFDLEGSSYVSAARRAAAAEGADGVAEFNGGSSAGAEGKALGSWSVTSVHNDLMQKIWRVLRTFHALAASLPPLQLAVFLAQNQQELQRILKKRGGETRGPPRGSSGGSGVSDTLNSARRTKDSRILEGTHSRPESFLAPCVSLREHEQLKQQQLLELGRQDPLRARQLQQQQRKVELDKQRQRGVQHLPFLQPQKTLNYPRLFGHTDVLLLPFDLEGDVMHQGAEGGEDSSAGAAPARGVGMCSSKDLSGSFCSGDWLYVGGEPLLHTSKAQEVHQLISGYIGISATFATPIDPQTHENALYTGRHYSFAFLIEAALKDKLRQVDADHHKPWDAELLLNLIAWIFAFHVRFFSASNVLRQQARAMQQQEKKKQAQQQQQQGDDLAAWQRRWARQLDESQDQPPPPQQAEEADEIQLLDRIDMIFCMQGYDTLLIHEFLLECMQQSVRVERLKHSSTSLCVAALRCLRQLLRMMEVHAQSRAAEIRSAVQQQFERWIGSGIVSDLSYALRRYKPRSTDPNVFLFAAECALSLLSLMQQLGGVVSASVDGFKTRKSRKTGGAAATALWDEDDFQQSQQHRTRQVTIDDIRSDFFRGDILSNCMAFVSRYSSNPFSVNSGMVAFMQELMEYRGKPNENVAIFFDLSHFLVFQRLLNDPQVTVNPRLSFLGDFAAWAVRGFFRLWRSNQLLPIELLFSKQRAPQTLTTCRAVGTAGVEDAENGRTANAAAAEDVVMTQHDFWCPASLPALQSLCSNYQRGTDAKVQQQMQQLPHLEPEEALKLAADEAAAAHGGQSAVWSGGVWTHEEDCMLMQYFEQFRGVRDYYTYIADLMGRHPKAVRKRLQHLRGRDQDNCDEPEAADEEDPNGSSPHGLGKDGERGEEGHDDSVGLSSALTAAVFAFRKKDWRAYCAEAGDVEADLRSSVTYVPEKLLHGVASALRDACRLQRQLEEMHSLSGGSASAQQEEIHVEEPAEAPMAVLDSPQFKALMEALSCTRKADSTSWCLRRDRQNELIAATVERLEVLASRELKDLEAEQQRHQQRSKEKHKQHKKRSGGFSFRSAALAGGLIDFQRRLLELGAAAESQAAGAATGLFADDASSWESEAATAAATQLREPKEALAALVGAFKKLLQQLEGEAPPHEEDKQQQGEDSAEERRLLKLEGLTWFTGLQKERSLRRLLWLMGMECSDGEARWQLPKSVSAATWKDRLQVFEAMHTRDLDDLEMLVEDVRPRHADAGTNHPNRDRERDRNGMREGHASRKKTHSKHKSKDKGSSRPVDQPLRIKTYPPKPTPQQQLVLVQKLLQWRRFIEGGEMGEVVGADEQLLRLISCLDTWLGRRAAAAADAVAACEQADEAAAAAAAADAEREVGNLVVTQHGEAGDEEHALLGSESHESLPVEAIGRGRLPTTLEALWVCAALGGQPTVGSDNKRWIWLADPCHLPASWLRRQLKLILRALSDPRLSSASALQEEADALAEIVQQQQQNEERQRKEEEKRHRQQQQQEEEQKRQRRKEQRRRKRKQQEETEEEKEDSEPERAEAPEPPPSDESSLAGNEEISDASESLESRRTPKQTLRGRRRSRVASPESSPMRPQPTEETAEAHPKVSTGDAPGTSTSASAAAAEAQAAQTAAEEEEADAFAAWIRDTVERPEGRSSAAAGELPQALQKFIAETEKEEQHLPLQLMEGVVCERAGSARDAQLPAAAEAGGEAEEEGHRIKRARKIPSRVALKALLDDCCRVAAAGEQKQRAMEEEALADLLPANKFVGGGTALSHLLLES